MSDDLYALDPKTPAQKELLSAALGYNTRSKPRG
jgi:hypothetical protein